MQSNEPYALIREVVESDLLYFARCMGAGANLPYAKWEQILKSLEWQFRDEVNAWRPNAQVMAILGKPVFLLENVGDQLILTGPPSWEGDPRRMMLAWQASMVHFFLKLRRKEVNIIVPSFRKAEIQALEILGCRKEYVFSDKSGTHFRYTCRPADFRPVI